MLAQATVLGKRKIGTRGALRAPEADLVLKRSVETLVKERAWSKACKVLILDGVHGVVDGDIMAKLKDLHPSSPPPPLPWLASRPPWQLT